MDVRTLAASTPPIQPTPGRRAGLDVTVSDRGVTAAAPKPAPAAPKPAPQVASSPETQQVLSDDEAAALEREFAYLQQRHEAATARRTAVYNQHGSKSAVQADPGTRGGLLDLVG